MNITNPSNGAAVSTRVGVAAGADARASASAGAATTSAKTAGSVTQGIDGRIARDTARLSALGRLTSAMDGVESAARALAANGMQTQVKATGQAVDATLASTRSAPGVHTVEVSQLAQAQRLESPPLARSDASIGAGGATLIKVDVGADGAAGHTTRLVKIDAGNDTLDGIAAAFKAAGIDAAVSKGAQGYSLQLNSESGAAHALRISVSGDPALGALLTWPAAGGAMTQTRAAQDALATVDGKAVRSASNTLENAIGGAELQLQATGASQVTVTRDPGSVAANAKAFVDQVNGLTAQLAGTKTGDASLDNLATQVRQQLTRTLGKLDQGALAQIGITSRNGVLSVDGKTLDAAVAADPDGVARLLSGSGRGLADVVGDQLGQGLGSGGIVEAARAGTSRELDQLGDQKAAVTQLQQRQAALLAQQYAGAVNGGYAAFGAGGAVPQMSLFDYL